MLKQNRVIALPIANSIFLDGLKAKVVENVPGLSPQDVIKAGPTNIQLLASSPEALHGLKVSYLAAVRNTLYLTLAAISIAFFFAPCMQWKRMPRAEKSEKNGHPHTSESNDCMTQIDGAP